jgi:sigma-B regulation protein RsbU (phosphoserine phosphatase)
MSTATLSWRIVPYVGDSPFKKVRVRDEARLQAVLRHLQAGECVALLGPPLCEKSRLLADVAADLQATGRYLPLTIDLWQAYSTDEESFFTSVVHLMQHALGVDHLALPAAAPDARAFQNYLAAWLEAPEGVSGSHLALLIDHLQALPHDLVHSLLLALRAAFMEREVDAPRQLVAVVTGGMNLVGLSTGPTSPFNIAKPVVVTALSAEQTQVLAAATLDVLGCPVSAEALQRIVEWVGGDYYLTPRLCAWCADIVRRHRHPRVTRAVVDRAAERVLLSEKPQAPIREAIRMIEEDPDTMLDMLHLLDQGALPRTRARQMITRTGTDRLQLSGAAVLVESQYQLKNQAFRLALARHFTPDRVGHILRIAGRWQEAIDYLAPLVAGEQMAVNCERLTVNSDRLFATDQHASKDLSPTSHRSPITAHRIPHTGYGSPRARPQLLEAIVQSIYATDALERAYEGLARGLRLGFGLPEVAIYRAKPAAGELELVYPRHPAPGQATSIDLHDPDCVEAQTFRYGNYALRGSADEARLVAALVGGQRPIGVLTVERYIERRDPHEQPAELPDLLRFLRHAASAIENVAVRAAYRRIGQAVLSASAVQPTLSQVLETVSEALGCDCAVLYLLDEAHSHLGVAAGVGRPWSAEWRSLKRLERGSSHPAATCLADGRMAVARGSDERLPAAVVDRYNLRGHVMVYLPLLAAGYPLGALELGYAGSLKLALTEENRRSLAAFADQVAIAVHNMQLLRRTDEALARKVEEITVAQQIQRAMLPRANPDAPGWQFAAVYEAARIVGGDFYDFYELPGKPPRLGVVVADVADKGVPAALFMALSRTIMRTTALSGRGPGSALLRANELIRKDSASDLFLSAVYVVIEAQTGRVIYVNAGHNRPLWYRAATGLVEELTARGVVLGILEEIKLEEQRIDLAPGDVLVLYTDGLTEALNAEGEEFGAERLMAAVAAHAPASAAEIQVAIMSAYTTFTGGGEVVDDVTCVVVKRG